MNPTKDYYLFSMFSYHTTFTLAKDITSISLTMYISKISLLFIGWCTDPSLILVPLGRKFLSSSLFAICSCVRKTSTGAFLNACLCPYLFSLLQTQLSAERTSTHRLKSCCCARVQLKLLPIYENQFLNQRGIRGITEIKQTICGVDHIVWDVIHAFITFQKFPSFMSRLSKTD